jgi:hypothetical protein
MLPTKFFRHSTLYFFTSMFLLGCQSHKPPPAPIVEIPQFPSVTYPMLVKGQSFFIDAPWNDQQDLQQQQDALFVSADQNNQKSVRQYLKVEKSPDDASQYILKSGLQLDSPEHNFDTFLQFTLKVNCNHAQTKLRCQYKAIDGLYSVDLPKSVSLKAEQTPAQMEKNEVATLSKLISRPIKITDTLKTSLTLAKLKTKLVKRHFLVDSTKAGLYLSRLQYNYEVELSQEKVKKHYLLTTRYYINPLSIDTYHADYVTPSNLAKKDLKKSIY